MSPCMIQFMHDTIRMFNGNIVYLAKQSIFRGIPKHFRGIVKV